MAGEGRTVSKNSGLVGGGKALGAAISLAGLAVATRALSVEAFGSLVALHALVLFCSEALTFKTSLAVVQYGTEPCRRGDAEGLRRILRFCATLDAASALLAFAGALAAGFGLRLVLPALAALPAELIVLYVSLVLLRQISASLGTLRLLNRFGTIGMHALVQPILRLIGGFVALKMGWGLAGFVCLYFVSAAASHLAMIALAVWRLHGAGLGEAVPRGLSFRAPDPTAWRFALLSNVEGTFSTVVTDAPVVLAGVLLGGDGAAVFRAAQDAASLLTGGVKVVDRTMFTELTKLASEGKRRELIGLTRRTSAVLALIGGVLAGLVLLLGPAPLVALFDKPAYGEAAGPLAVLFLAAAFSGAGTPFLPAFYANGRPGLALLARSAEAGGVALLIWPLSAWLDVIGVATAILCGGVAFALLAFWLAFRQPWLGQAASSASRASEATSPTLAERSGGPGQAGSLLCAPAKARGVS